MMCWQYWELKILVIFINSGFLFVDNVDNL